MRKTILTSVTFLGLLALMVAFNNCSKVGFSQSASLTAAQDVTPSGSIDPVATPPPAAVAIANCAQAVAAGKLVVKNTVVNFADSRTESGRAIVCQWAVAPQTQTAVGDLQIHNGFNTARYEQQASLSLPSDAVICNVTMQTDKQTFKYDDVFYMTFNNKVLASNLASSLTQLPSTPISAKGAGLSLLDYQWANGVRGTGLGSINSKADDYCLGEAQGLSSCTWPLSQQTGDIKFSFDPEILINIGVTAAAKDQRFGFVITGDNDASTDCYHEALSFNTTVSYYENK